ncbi:MAG TPA: hypothetical protein DCX14_02915 [Flavobacteriales bacterium]|nr:hypothetical protein [Flavobacteriales bacterium]
MKPLIPFIFCAVSSICLGQKTNNLALDGKVIDHEAHAIVNASVELIDEDGKRIWAQKTDRDGSFKVYIDFEHKYELVFSNLGCQSKSLLINTFGVSCGGQEWGYEYGGFNVKLEQSKVPTQTIRVAEIYYDPNIQNFDFRLLQH